MLKCVNAARWLLLLLLLLTPDIMLVGQTYRRANFANAIRIGSVGGRQARLRGEVDGLFRSHVSSVVGVHV